MRRLLSNCLILCALLTSPALLAAEPWDALQQGGVVILLRHAQTEPGVGDPPGFRLDDCSSQRQLSAAGRQQAIQFGARLAARGLRITQVFSSAWCRCMETARLAFPEARVENLPALDSFFADATQATARAAALREALRTLPATGVTVWVTHQVNASALSGQFLAMGEALVLKPEQDGSFRVMGSLAAPAP